MSARRKTQRETQALRKQVLIMRATLERAELGQHLDDLRRGATLTGLLSGVLGQGGFKGMTAGMATRGLPMILSLFKRHPVLGSSASLLLSRLGLPLLVKAAKWGGLALLAWRLIGPLSQKMRRGMKH